MVVLPIGVSSCAASRSTVEQAVSHVVPAWVQVSSGLGHGGNRDSACLNSFSDREVRRKGEQDASILP